MGDSLRTGPVEWTNDFLGNGPIFSNDKRFGKLEHSVKFLHDTLVIIKNGKGIGCLLQKGRNKASTIFFCIDLLKIEKFAPQSQPPDYGGSCLSY